MATTVPTDRLRREWRALIRATLAPLPAGATDREKRAALRAASPYRSLRRDYHYRVWCAEVRAALKASEPRVGSVGWTVTRTRSPPGHKFGFWIDVACSWRVGCTGCLACGPARERHATLARSREFMALIRACRIDPADRTPQLVLCDWLEENGYDDLGAVIRAKLKETT